MPPNLKTERDVQLCYLRWLFRRNRRFSSKPDRIAFNRRFYRENQLEDTMPHMAVCSLWTQLKGPVTEAQVARARGGVAEDLCQAVWKIYHECAKNEDGGRAVAVEKKKAEEEVYDDQQAMMNYLALLKERDRRFEDLEDRSRFNRKFYSDVGRKGHNVAKTRNMVQKVWRYLRDERKPAFWLQDKLSEISRLYRKVYKIYRVVGPVKEKKRETTPKRAVVAISSTVIVTGGGEPRQERSRPAEEVTSSPEKKISESLKVEKLVLRIKRSEMDMPKLEEEQQTLPKDEKDQLTFDQATEQKRTVVTIELPFPKTAPAPTPVKTAKKPEEMSAPKLENPPGELNPFCLADLFDLPPLLTPPRMREYPVEPTAVEEVDEEIEEMEEEESQETPMDDSRGEILNLKQQVEEQKKRFYELVQQDLEQMRQHVDQMGQLDAIFKDKLELLIGL